MLKSTTGWYEDGHGVDKYGFNVLPAGYRSNLGRFDIAGKYAYFWSATECTEDYANLLGLLYSHEDALLGNLIKYDAYSVRCLRGSN